VGLNAEGSQLQKIDGKYYLFNITWPRGDMRTQIVHRASTSTISGRQPRSRKTEASRARLTERVLARRGRFS
jgi:hypothetical protein